jgi:protein HIRA/HIR1
LPIVNTATDNNRKAAIIVSAKVRPTGHPIISLSNGTALTFDGDLESWTEVSTTWWSKGSDLWEARSRASTKEGRGVVRIMESEANDYLMAQQKQDADYVMLDGEDEELKPSIEGEEQAKLGNGEDWKMALTLGHLESRMAAAIVLDSLTEYKTFLSLYVRKLAEEAFRGKAEELVKELLGPVYHRPGREDNWQPHLLGVHKHTLLRDVTSIWGKSKNFSKLATETNDTLKKMLADG